MFRRVLCFLLISVILLSSVSFLTSFAEVSSDEIKTSGESEILGKLGIIKSSFDIEKEVTRGEFAVYLAALSGYSDIAGADASQAFTDVKKGKSYFNAVGVLNSLKVIKGTGNGAFRPDDKLLYRDAVTLLVRLLGYEAFAEASGGYPTGYLLTASSERISSGVRLGMDENVNGENLSILLLNALDVKVKLQYSYGTDSLKMKDGETLGASVFNLYKGRGIVEANELTGLGSSSDAVSEGTVSIGGYLYLCGETDISEMLGLDAEFYFIDKTEEGGLSEIIYYESKYGDKARIILESGKILGVSGNKLIYSVSEGKEKELPFDGNTYFIYNGIAYPELSYEEIIPESGEVILTDSDGNGVFDVISVLSLKDYSVYSASAALGKISVEGRESFDFNNMGIIYDIEKEGKRIEPSEIYVNEVLSVAESKDGKYVKIFVSPAQTEGTVTELGEDENGSFAVIGENKFYISPVTEYIPEIGKTAVWSLNFRGELFDELEEQAGEKYGYLLKIGYKGVVDKAYKFKVMTSKGIAVYEPAEKVSVNGNTKVPAEKAAEDSALRVNGVPDSEGNITEQQLIKYRLNEKGQLTHIYTYEDRTATPQRKSRDDDAFTFDYKATGSVTATYRSGNRALGTRYLVNASTVIFEAPMEFSEKESDFAVHNISYLAHDRTYTEVEFYGANFENYVGAVIMRSAAKSATKIPNYLESVIVTKVSTYAENGERGTKIEGILKGGEVSYKCLDDEVGDYDEEYGNGILFSELKPGDVVQLSESSAGFVDQMRLLYRYDGNPQYTLSKSESLVYMNMGLMSSVGSIIEHSPSAIVVNCKDGVSPEWDRTFMKNDKTHFFIFDTKKEKLTEVEPTDIEIGAMVYVRGSYSVLYDMIWYK